MLQITWDTAADKMTMRMDGQAGTRLATKDGVYMYGMYQVKGLINGVSGVVSAFYVSNQSPACLAVPRPVLAAARLLLPTWWSGCCCAALVPAVALGDGFGSPSAHRAACRRCVFVRRLAPVTTTCPATTATSLRSTSVRRADAGHVHACRHGQSCSHAITQHDSCQPSHLTAASRHTRHNRLSDSLLQPPAVAEFLNGNPTKPNTVWFNSYNK
jgi:hypothetical protein